MNAEMRHQRAGSAALRTADGETVPRIAGVAAVYYRAGDPGTEYELWEGAVERILPGAFTRAAVSDDVYCCFNHDPSLLLGRTSAKTLKLEARADGLHYEVTPSDSRLYQELVNSMQRGDINQSSFKFIPTDVKWKFGEDRQVREISGVQLIDVSPVTVAAYSGTSAGVRHVDLRSEARAAIDEIERTHAWKTRQRAAQWRAVQMAMLQ